MIVFTFNNFIYNVFFYCPISYTVIFLYNFFILFFVQIQDTVLYFSFSFLR